MRIRSIRPEFWASEDIAALPWDARLVFIGLWSYVDDDGVGRDVERLIVADLFPLDEDLTEASRRVHGALNLLAERGLISRYEVDGKRYLHVTNFLKHQVINRPSKGRYPLPPGVDPRPTRANTPDPESTPDLFTEDSVSPHPTPDVGEGEKGRRGEGSRPDKPDPSSSFAAFYSAYPRKVARAAAEKAWAKAVKRATPDVILAGVARFPFSPDPQYIPHPATWLNQDRWADQPTTPGARHLTVLAGGDDVSLSKQQIDEILGPDYWQVPAPPQERWDEDPRIWAREQATKHRAERVQKALAVLRERQEAQAR